MLDLFGSLGKMRAALQEKSKMAGGSSPQDEAVTQNSAMFKAEGQSMDAEEQDVVKAAISASRNPRAAGKIGVQGENAGSKRIAGFMNSKSSLNLGGL